MKTFRWNNPYIALLPTLSKYILAIEGAELNPEEETYLRGKCQNFTSLYLEFGSGSGEHLITLASQNPESLFVGFELRYKRCYKTAKKAQDLQLNNLLVIKALAQRAPSFFARESLAGIHINFPDPWDKRRWKKNRLLTEGFLRELHSLFLKGGFISYKTDHLEYFEEVVQLFKNLSLYKLESLTYDLKPEDFPGQNTPTEFERLFRSKKEPILFLRAIKA